MFKLKGADYVVGVSLLLLWASLIVTNIVLTQSTSAEATTEQAEAVVEVMEGNPVAKWFLSTWKLQFFFAMVFQPAVLFGAYSRFRKNDEVAIHFAAILLIVAVTDLLNNVGRMLGALL